MAHKPSCDSRMAGGKEWRRVKSGSRKIRFEQKNPPPHIVEYGNRKVNEANLATVQKDMYKQGQKDYSNGLERQSNEPQYNAGYSYAEYTASKKD